MFPAAGYLRIADLDAVHPHNARKAIALFSPRWCLHVTKNLQKRTEALNSSVIDANIYLFLIDFMSILLDNIHLGAPIDR